MEINNFYTVTVYEKGAEVVRMMQTLVGREGFAKGMTLYFARHDGHAVTCDDFAQAIADANPQTDLAALLPQFKLWYSQAGTPRLQAGGHHDAAAQTYTLTFKQHCPATPGQADKQPFVIPVRMGLVGADGQNIPLQLADESAPGESCRVFVVTQGEEVLTFANVATEPVPSLLQGFSAPVILDIDYSDAHLVFLLAHDADPFNRWEAGQRLMLRYALQSIAAPSASAGRNGLSEEATGALRGILRDPALDAAFKELVLTLPSETYIAEQLDVVDPQRVHAVREAMRLQLATVLADDWRWAFELYQDAGAYSPDATSAGRRSLAGLALGYLCLGEQGAAGGSDKTTPWADTALKQFRTASNMTDRASALSALVQAGAPQATAALQQFHALFRNEALVLDKWFALQAGATDRGGNILPVVRQLMKHPDFTLGNPNRARSLIFSFCSANPGAFHRPDAGGYVFWSERVLELDAINPQVAARLARAMDRWARLAEPYRTAAGEAIKRVAAKPDLSNDVREVVTRALTGTGS